MTILSLVGLMCLLGMAIPNVKDAALKLTRALPASTSAVTTVLAIDTQNVGGQEPDVEFLLSAPAVTTAQLPDTKTMTYAVVMSANSDLSGPTTLYPSVIVQTGAASAGAAAATFRFRLPSNASRYIGFSVTPSGSGTGDASGVSATLEAVF